MALTRIRRGISQRNEQISTLLRLGPPTLDAYLKIVRTLVSERLWDLPPRALRPASARLP